MDAAALEAEYMEQLTVQQRKALELAKTHLKTSFCLQKSLHYTQWLKERKEILELEAIMEQMPLSQLERDAHSRKVKT